MAVSRTLCQGTNGATVTANTGHTGTEPLYESAAVSNGTLTYDTSSTLNGTTSSILMAASGSGIRNLRKTTGLSTMTFAAQMTFEAPTTGGGALLAFAVGATRILSIPFSSGRAVTVLDAAAATLGGAGGTFTLVAGTKYEVDLVAVVHATVAASGVVKFKIREAGTTTVLASYSGAANLGTAAITQFWAISPVTSSSVTNFHVYSIAFDDTASDYITPWFITSTVGPRGRVAVIGDSTIAQVGNGATDVPAAFVAAGWLAGDIWFYGVGSKDLSSADTNGYTAIQNIQQARAALGGEPAVWVFSLSINNMGQTDATNTTRIGAIMSEINSIGSPGRVLWVGGTQTPSLDANRLRFNVLMRTLMATYTTLYHTDLDSWMHNGRDETGLWASPADANFAHMSTAGYAIKNAFMATQARKLVSHADVNYTALQVGTSPVRALYVGGIIGWAKS